MEKVTGIRHIGIVTKNFDKMTEFYTSLGFKVFWDKFEDLPNTDMIIHTIKLKSTDGSVIELCDNHYSSFHIAFNNKSQRDRIVWLLDPDGNSVEIVNEELL